MISKKQLAEINFAAMLPQLTALWCLLNMTEKGIEFIPLKISACLLLILPKLAASFRFWMIFIFTYLIYLSSNYVIADNHRWLFLYWMISIGLASWLDQKKVVPFLEGMKKSSAPLIIASFSLAFLWKIFNFDYVNGSFFEFVLAGGDNRLQDFVILALNYAPEEIKYNTYLIQNYLLSGSGILSFQSPIIVSSWLRFTSYFFTYYALAIEFIVPLLYLFSFNRPQLKRYASFSLLLFIGSVYFITPVYGFGQLLALLGLAANEDKRDEKWFIAAFLLMVALNAPWTYFLVF